MADALAPATELVVAVEIPLREGVPLDVQSDAGPPAARLVLAAEIAGHEVELPVDDLEYHYRDVPTILDDLTWAPGTLRRHTVARVRLTLRPIALRQRAEEAR